MKKCISPSAAEFWTTPTTLLSLLLHTLLTRLPLILRASILTTQERLLLTFGTAENAAMEILRGKFNMVDLNLWVPGSKATITFISDEHREFRGFELEITANKMNIIQNQAEVRKVAFKKLK